LKITDYNFELPEKLIAKEPASERSSSKLLVVEDRLIDKTFSDIHDYLHEGDLLIINDTKVFKARLNAFKSSGGKVEILLERKLDEFHALALTKSNRPLKENDILNLVQSEVIVEIIQKNDYLCKIKFSENIDQVIEEYGAIPIPPYMDREPKKEDYERYQTIYANHEKERSSAAPTAGLHFENSLLDSIQNKGVNLASITLDIGLGTFKPITESVIENHKMHSERIYLSEATSYLINQTLDSNSKIISVGTTSLRCLEAIYHQFGEVRPFEGETDIFIYPGFKFNVVDSLITNFHLPKTTLLLLVSAFAGEDTIKTAYKHAINEEYMFFSYGDAMLLNRKEDI
jgi:S-adenosylmethionine:tRNA ribosyltransferase-isomerase